MGAMAELYAERMRGPEPDEADQWVLEIAQVMRAKRERHTRRHQRILEALRHGVAVKTMDATEVCV
jgi:hypothetical protein